MAEYESLEAISDYMSFIRKYEQSEHNDFIAQTKAKVATLRNQIVATVTIGDPDNLTAPAQLKHIVDQNDFHRHYLDSGV